MRPDLRARAEVPAVGADAVDVLAPEAEHGADRARARRAVRVDGEKRVLDVAVRDRLEEATRLAEQRPHEERVLVGIVRWGRGRELALPRDVGSTDVLEHGRWRDHDLVTDPALLLDRGHSDQGNVDLARKVVAGVEDVRVVALRPWHRRERPQ